jgi:hypothetical protein
VLREKRQQRRKQRFLGSDVVQMQFWCHFGGGALVSYYWRDVFKCRCARAALTFFWGFLRPFKGLPSRRHGRRSARRSWRGVCFKLTLI